MLVPILLAASLIAQDSAPPAEKPAEKPAETIEAAPIDLPVDTAAPPAPELPRNFAGPRIIVPAPMRAGAPVGAAHRPLVDALKKRFGPRVVEVKDVLDAQGKTEITASDLKAPPPLKDSPRAGPPPPPALARLGEALDAKRAVLVDIKEKESVVLVYPGLDGAPAVVVKVPKRKADYLNSKWAEAIGDAIEKLAAGALEDPPEELDEGERTAQTPSDVRAEIAAEEARDRARRDAIVAKKRAAEEGSDPIVAALIGAGGAVRFMEVSGGLSSALAPVRNGVVPTASLFLSTSPLRAIPAMRTSEWADAVVELSYRKGFATVVDPNAPGANAAACPYDDDDLAVRASYRVLFGGDSAARAFIPRVGLGAGAGLERVLFGCALPIVSTNYPNAAAFVRITQPIVPRGEAGTSSMVELDVVAGPRAVIASGLPTGATEGVLATTYHPSWNADAFVVARPLPFLAARAGTRMTGTHYDDSSGFLVIDDTRVSFELQVGGSF